MIKRFYKKENLGITLIALVITIVVLIILAAVAINLTLGNNGIFNRAKTAKEKYQNAEAQEQTEIAKTTNEINNYVSGNRDYEDEINRLKDEIQNLKNANSYSTTKKRIGTWTDGKPIYRKVLTFDSIATHGIKYVSVGENVNQYINCFGVGLDSTTGVSYTIPFVHVENVAYNIGVLYYNNNSSSNKNTVRLTCGSSKSTTGGYLVVDFTIDDN